MLEDYKEIKTSATMIEQYPHEKGTPRGHNRIHRILLESKLAKKNKEKKKKMGKI